jgi:regulatory protein
MEHEVSTDVVSGVITKVERQKRSKDRYNLFINEEFAFSVHEDVLIKYNLFKGSLIGSEEMKGIILAQDKQQSYLDAIRLLSFRLRSEKELKLRLKQKGYEAQLIADTLIRLKQEQYVDDRLFAELLTKQRIQSQKKGRNWVKQELQQKGLTSEQISNAMEHVDEQTEYRNAYELIYKKYAAELKAAVDVQKTKRKAISLLQRRGYGSTVISNVMRELSKSIGDCMDLDEDMEVPFEYGD